MSHGTSCVGGGVHCPVFLYKVLQAHGDDAIPLVFSRVDGDDRSVLWPRYGRTTRGTTLSLIANFDLLTDRAASGSGATTTTHRSLSLSLRPFRPVVWPQREALVQVALL